MQDKFDGIWDAVLKAAVVENSYNEIKDYPSREVINQIEVPEQYDRKMNRVIRHYRQLTKMRKLANYAWRASSLLLVVAGTVFLILLQFDEVRASCKNVIVHIYETFVQYDFQSLNDSRKNFEIGFVPEGYSLEKTESNKDGMNMIYKDSLGNEIEIGYFSDNRTIYLDNEHYQISDIQINSVYGKYFESELSNFDHYIAWSTEEGSFYIASMLDKATMKKIAENVK
ncbi:MAG: DUF4367 domain-containing protein [Lachnospiraceae bacterium]|nr:DUF4367 domain-containing protein [Lachnospiraceae bacterium]